MSTSPDERQERAASPVPSAVTKVEGQHIRARLRRIAIDHRALAVAIEDAFGVDFERHAWALAFDGDDPHDVNRVAPVISGFERIVNGLVEAARSGLIASGIAQPTGTPETVRADLELVRDDGGLSDRQCDLLVDLRRTRNQLQHVYIDVSADDARDAVRRLRSNLPTLTRALNDWFKRYDVGA
jgi:uncharacterized protein YutE (UPF0331/DUF86 family)